MLIAHCLWLLIAALALLSANKFQARPSMLACRTGRYHTSPVTRENGDIAGERIANVRHSKLADHTIPLLSLFDFGCNSFSKALLLVWIGRHSELMATTYGLAEKLCALLICFVGAA